MPHEEQPWMVFAARPAPLADLLHPKTQRNTVLPTPVENEDSADSQKPVKDAATPPGP
jgi:hypothetical protein